MLAFDFDQISPTQMGLAALVVASIVVFLASRRQRRPEPLARTPRRDPDVPAADVRAIQGDLANLIAELESLSERLSADAAARQEQLHALIAQADERIAALQNQLNAPAARAGVPMPKPATGLGPLPSLRSIVAPASRPAAATTGADDRHGAIYALADEGLTPVEIAQRVGQRIGEIELILNLRPKPAAPRRPA